MAQPTSAKHQNTVRYAIEAGVLAGLTLAVLVPWGCSSLPLSPQSIPTHNTFPLPNGLVAHPGEILTEGEVSQTTPQTIPISLDPEDTVAVEKGIWSDSIDSRGGVIEMVVEGQQSFFFVPTDGVEDKTEIRVTIYRREDAVDKRITEFHFEPGGLVFNAPAMLSYRTVMKDGEKLELSWWDNSAQKWIRSAEAVVVAGYVTFPVFHFSDYRTTERVSLGGQRGAQ